MTGFTLLELLAVIALLAILATGALVAYDGTDEQARIDVTKMEMSELRNALLQFRRDTSVFPCGVYHEPNVDGDVRAYSLDSINMNMSDMPAPTAGEDVKAAWCQENALIMLTEYPFELEESVQHRLWNPDTKRGWNGAYISREGLTDAWGNRFKLINPELDFSRPPAMCIPPEISAPFYECRSINDEAYISNSVAYSEYGDIARIVSFGPNNSNDSESTADPCSAGGDDIVLCLLR
jgi:prepilin-type N-terminal cleavage/methylation domain-containing protein